MENTNKKLSKKNKKLWIILSLFFILIAIVGTVFYFKFYNVKIEKKKYKITKTELSTLKKEVKISLFRYEKDLFSLPMDDFASLAQEVKKLAETYPEELIEKEAWKDTMRLIQLRNYLKDPTIRDIYELTLKTYPSLSDLQEELEDAFAYYRYFYSQAPLPTFYTIVPGIDTESPSIYGYDDKIFIHLDMYLGENATIYKKIGIPIYISQRMDKTYLAIDCFKKAIVYKHLPTKYRVTLLDHMIYEGKKLYFTGLMFPQRSEKDIIGYTEEKYEWATKYQPEVWNYLIEKELLFSKNEEARRKFIDEAPFTKPFTNASPGRLGAFLGWKIVQGFMEKSDLSLEELMQNTDSQEILKESGYKPLKVK